MATLCEACYNLLSPEGLESLASPNGYRAHGTVANLTEAASYGCPMCYMLTDSNYAIRPPRYYNTKRLKGWNVRLRISDDRGGNIQKLLLSIARPLGPYDPSNPGSGSGLLKYMKAPPPQENWNEAMSFDVAFKDGIYVNEGRQTIRFDSSLAMDWAREWVKSCARHEQCSLNHTSTLPARVLEIDTEGDGKLRLLETKGVNGKYVALSYCWGGPQKSVTNKSTIEQNFNAISQDNLSTTIKDALKVTEELGFRYLWVDALCIIQDSDDDKVTEIVKMDQYYKNASVTIIASAASGAQEGFLNPGKLSYCQLPYSRQDGKEAIASITHSIYDPEVKSTSFDEHRFGFDGECEDAATVQNPVSTRGWTLQEKLLSPCRLRFGLHGMDWQCQTKWGTFQAAFPTGTAGSSTTIGSSENDPPDFKFFSKGDYEPSLATMITGWAQTIEEYTSRNLTVADDKLPAISAIAKEFNRVSGDRYLAGHWEKTLMIELTWQPAHDERDDEDIKEKPEERYRIPSWPWGAENYRAPSWSWAAWNGKVEMEKARGSFITQGELVGSYIGLESSQAPYGKVREYAYLDIEGQLRPLSTKPSTWSNEFGDNYPEFKELFEDDAFKLDVPTKEDIKYPDSDVNVVCLWLWKWYHNPENHSDYDSEDEKMPELAVGLILQSIYAVKGFRRIGRFTLPVQWFEGFGRETIRVF